MSSEAAERLRGYLREVPVRSGIEYRNWMALLDKALRAERMATVERLRAAGVLMVSRAEGDAKESYLIPLAILDAEAAR